MNLSPTPSEENLRNTLHASTCDALESFMKKEEESYDGFMSGFLYLKKEDVVQWDYRRRTKAADGTSEKIQKPTGLCADGTSEKTQKPTGLPADGTSEKIQKPTGLPADCTSEKIQKPTGLPADCTSEKIQKPTGLPADCTSEKTQKPTGPQQDEGKNVDSLPADEELEQEVLSEGSTTSRLEERQVIKTGTQVKFDNFVVDDEEEEEEEEDFKTGHKGLSDLLGNSSGYTASFDHFTDERNRILTRISDNSGTFHNKELATQSSQCDRTDKEHSAPLEESELIDPDKEFEIITEEYSTNFGPQGDTINPGEVEDTHRDPTLQDLQNITQLDFAATYRTEGVQHDADSQDQAEQCSNDVMPFTLDDDFDYDNVTLTPKYTFAEMKQLEGLLRGMQAQTENVIKFDPPRG